MEAKQTQFFGSLSGKYPIVRSGKYRLGVKTKGGREFFNKTIFCESRKEAKRKAREFFGKKGIVTAA